VPYLKLSAVHDEKAGTLTLFCLNRHLAEPMALELTAKGFAHLEVVSAHQLCDSDLTALNTTDKPDRIKPSPIGGIEQRGTDLRATLSPASWNVIRLGKS